VGAPIPNLHGTPMHVTAVELYQGHHSGTAGMCVRCGERAPCPVRSHAASVIAAVGEDPRWYDGRLLSGASPQTQLGPRPGQPVEASTEPYRLDRVAQSNSAVWHYQGDAHDEP
jgi:hypothetical protein